MKTNTITAGDAIRTAQGWYSVHKALPATQTLIIVKSGKLTTIKMAKVVAHVKGKGELLETLRQENRDIAMMREIQKCVRLVNSI